MSIHEPDNASNTTCVPSGTVADILYYKVISYNTTSVCIYYIYIIYVYMHIYRFMCMYIYIWHTHVYIYIYMYIYAYVCMYVCIFQTPALKPSSRQLSHRSVCSAFRSLGWFLGASANWRLRWTPNWELKSSPLVSKVLKGASCEGIIVILKSLKWLWVDALKQMIFMGLELPWATPGESRNWFCPIFSEVKKNIDADYKILLQR